MRRVVVAIATSLRMLAIVAAASFSILGGGAGAEGSGKGVVFSEGEDATSYFDTIYFLDETEGVTRVIQIWNGGCCQMPVIEEFLREGSRFVWTKSYTLDEKPAEFPKAILCEADLVKMTIEPTHAALEGFDAAEIEHHHLEEAVLFSGC